MDLVQLNTKKIFPVYAYQPESEKFYLIGQTSNGVSGAMECVHRHVPSVHKRLFQGKNDRTSTFFFVASKSDINHISGDLVSGSLNLDPMMKGLKTRVKRRIRREGVTDLGSGAMMVAGGLLVAGTGFVAGKKTGLDIRSTTLEENKKEQLNGNHYSASPMRQTHLVEDVKVISDPEIPIVEQSGISKSNSLELSPNQHSLKKCKEMVKQLETDITTQHHQLISHNSELEKQGQELADKTSAMQVSLSQLQKNIEERTSELKEVTEQKAIRVNELDGLEIKVHTEKELRTKHKATKDELINQIREKRASIADYETRLADLVGKVEKIKARTQDESDKLLQLRGDNALKEVEYEHLMKNIKEQQDRKDELMSSTQHDTERKEGVLAELNDINLKLEISRTAFRINETQVTAANSTLKEENIGLEKEKNALEIQKTKVTKEIELLSKQKVELSSDVQIKNNEIKEAHARDAGLKDQISSKVLELASAEKEVQSKKELSKVLSESNKTLDLQMESESLVLADYSDEKKKLMQKITEKQGVVEKHEFTLGALIGEVAKHTQEIEVQKEQLSKLGIDIAQKEGEMTQAIAQRNQELANLQQIIKGHQANNDELTSQNSKLREQARLLDSEISSMENKILQLRENLEELTQKVSLQKSNQDKLEKDRSAKLESYETILKGLNEQDMIKKNNIIKLNAMNATIKTSEAVVAKLEKQISAKAIELASTESKVNSKGVLLSQQYTLLETGSLALQNTQGQIVSKATFLQEQSKLLELLASKKTTLKIKIQTKKKRLKSISSELEKAQREVDSRKTALEELSTSNELLQLQIDQQKATLEKLTHESTEKQALARQMTQNMNALEKLNKEIYKKGEEVKLQTFQISQNAIAVSHQNDVLSKLQIKIENGTQELKRNLGTINQQQREISNLDALIQLSKVTSDIAS